VSEKEISKKIKDDPDETISEIVLFPPYPQTYAYPRTCSYSHIGLTKGKPYSQLFNSKKNSSQCLTPICSFFLCFSCFHAPFWWQEAKKRHNGDNDGSNPTIPWAWFEREFNDQYLDVMSREALRQQFVSLKQGSGTVQDYNMKCDNLMRYAPDIVADDFRLRRQYLEGLHPRFTQIIDLPEWD